MLPHLPQTGPNLKMAGALGQLENVGNSIVADCARLKARSVAIPAISCGIFNDGRSMDKIAFPFISAIRDKVSSMPNQLSIVRFVVSKNTLAPFKNVFKQL